MDASSIYPFFHEINLQTSTGIKTFNNAIIGLYDKEKYKGIQYRITKLLQAGKDQGAKYGWLNNAAMIEMTPRVHISVYYYHGLITNQMVETESHEIWTIVNNANIQHCIRSNIMYLFHRTSIIEKSCNPIKKHKHHW